MADARPPEFTGGAADLPDDLKRLLAAELEAVFAALMPGRTVEAITPSRSFGGYSADPRTRAVLGVEVRFADGYETHIVKLGRADAVRSDFDGWRACTAGRQVASRIFAPVRLVELPGDRCAVLYQDAYTLYGRGGDDDRPRALEDVVGDVVNFADPDPLSVERAVAHVFTDLGRWFYGSAAPDPAAAAAFYRDRLGVGAADPGRRAGDGWDADDRPGLRRDAVWVLCGGDKPAADPGTARYLDPVEFVAWAVGGAAAGWPPDTLVGPAHGDLHARNVLLGACRGEAEYPAVFDYGSMGPRNVLAWDFAKLETELTRVLLPPLLDDPAVVAELAEKSRLRPKLVRPAGLPSREAVRADRLRAFLYVHEQLHELTARVETRSAAEPIRPPAHPPTGRAGVDRLLAVLLRVRKEAALCLGFGRHPRQHRWRDEYFFALAVQSLLNAKAGWNYSPHQVECALVAGGVALARSPAAVGAVRAAAAAGPTDGPFPSYRVPLAVTHRLWTARRYDEAAAFVERVAVEPAAGAGPLAVRPAARHAVPLQAEAALVQMEVGRAGPAERLLQDELRPLAREFGDYETLARLGRLFKDAGDRKWEDSGLPFDRFEKSPGWHMYLEARGVYAEAFEATGDAYVGVNAAALFFLTHDPAAAAGYADRVARACAARTDTPSGERYWLFATAGEAAFLRGRPQAGVPDATDYYRNALAELTAGRGGMANSSYKQLCRFWKALGGDEGEERVGPLLRLFEANPDIRPSLTLNYLGRTPIDLPPPPSLVG